MDNVLVILRIVYGSGNNNYLASPLLSNWIISYKTSNIYMRSGGTKKLNVPNSIINSDLSLLYTYIHNMEQIPYTCMFNNLQMQNVQYVGMRNERINFSWILIYSLKIIHGQARTKTSHRTSVAIKFCKHRYCNRSIESVGDSIKLHAHSPLLLLTFTSITIDIETS